MTIRVRLLYGDDGFSFRHASKYVFDPRDLDAAGNPKAGMRPSLHLELEPGEVEFDHEPSEAELAAAFPNRAARLKENTHATPDRSSSA